MQVPESPRWYLTPTTLAIGNRGRELFRNILHRLRCGGIAGSGVSAGSTEWDHQPILPIWTGSEC